MMQFHQPSLRNRSSSLSEISASSTCLRSMSLYLAYHCTGNLWRGVSVWFRYGRTFKGHGSRNGTLFTSDGSGEGPCASTATSATMKRNKVSCRDHNSQPRPGESVPALQRRRSSEANPRNSTSPCVASCAKADASETEISRVLVSGSFSTQTQEVLQPEESLPPPLWKTFASNASGVWGGVGAVFSPTTGEMEAVCVGPKSLCLYDAHIMCTVETAEVKDGAKATIGLKRTMLWRADNAHVENGSGDKPVLDTDSNVDPTNQPAEEAVNFRGESGEATLLGEINSSSLQLVGADEVEVGSLQPDMLSAAWQDVPLSELEGSNALEVLWDADGSVGAEVVTGWEQGEGAACGGGIEEQVTREPMTVGAFLFEQSDEKMDKQWEEVEKIEDGPDIFASTYAEGGLSPTSLPTPYHQQMSVEMVSSVEGVIPAALTRQQGPAVVHPRGSQTAWDDVHEEDFIGQEQSLVFFEDGSYSRGPFRITPLSTNNDQHAFEVEHCLAWGGHRRLRVLQTICMGGDGDNLQVLRVLAYDEEWLGPASLKFLSRTGAHTLLPWSQRSRLSPTQLSGTWKVFAVIASVLHPPSGSPAIAFSCKETSVSRIVSAVASHGICADTSAACEAKVLYLPGNISATVQISESGMLTIGVGWLVEGGTRICIERDYDQVGNLVQVRSSTEVKGGWIGGRM